MSDLITQARKVRSKLILSSGENVVIFRENPIFEYFSDDERPEGILVSNGKTALIGEKEMDDVFVPMQDSDFCAIPPFYEHRKVRSCATDDSKMFEYPLKHELEFISMKKKEISESIGSVLSSVTEEDTEISVSDSIRNKMCQTSIPLYYRPIVAFDSNTRKVWNRPGTNNAKTIMYVEVASKCNGLTALFSETFLISNSEAYKEKYLSILDAVEKVKGIFVEGNTTLDISRKLENYRNQKLYLTTPLFPFSYHPIPGPNEKIRTGDVAIFDLWADGTEFSIRKKVTAVAGSYAATIL